MELRLIFEGDVPLSPRVLADVLRHLDRRLFVYEKQALKRLTQGLPDELVAEYPELIQQLNKERLARWRRELNRQYRAGEFSMLYVTAVREGSIEVILLPGAHVLKFVLADVGTLVATVMGGIVLMSMQDAIKEAPLYKALTKLFTTMLRADLQERVIKSVMDLARRFRQEPPIVEEVIEDPPGPRRRLLDMGPSNYGPHYIPKALIAKMALPDYLTTDTTRALFRPEPTEEEKALITRALDDYEVKELVDRPPENLAPERQLEMPDIMKVESITVRHRTGVPTKVEALIKRITVKGPPLTYQ